MSPEQYREIISFPFLNVKPKGVTDEDMERIGYRYMVGYIKGTSIDATGWHSTESVAAILKAQEITP